MLNILLVLFGIVVIIFTVKYIIPLILYPFANHLKFMQKYYCKLGWHCHMNDYQFNNFDGVSEHCTCKWCGYKGLVDSQGNLF